MCWPFFASLVSFGHCVVCPSSTYSFLLPLLLIGYLLVIVLSVLLLLTPSYCLFGIFWSLCCLSFFYLLLLIASLVSFGHCVVCPSLTYSFLLPLWYLLVIVLSSTYSFLLPPFGHCVVCPFSTYSFLLLLWYLLVIVLSVLLLTPSYCLFGIFWPLCCLSFFDLLLLIASLVSFGHCVVCPSSTYSFLLPLWYLLVIVLSVLLRLTPSYCLFGIFWSLCCLSFFDLLLLIASLVSFGHCVVCPSSTYSFLLPLWYLLAIVLSVLLRLTPSYCFFGIFWPLCCLSFFYLLLLIVSLVFFGHCVVYPSSTYSFLLPLWYLLVIVLSVLLLLTPSYCPFGIFWSLCCLSFYLLLLIDSLVSFGHCVVCPSSTYSFLLPLWYLLVIVLSVLLLLTPSYCLFGIFWSLCCLSFFDLLLLIASLVSFGHCVVCPSFSTYSFLLPLWYLLVIVLSVLLRLTPSYCLFGIFWSLCCLSFFYLLLLIAPLVSFGHCVVCPSSTYSFLLLFGIFGIVWSLCCLLVILLRLTPSYCPFGIFWPLCCLSFSDLLLLIASLVSFGHCVVCPSSTYSFLLSLWYFLVIVLSILLRLTPSYCLWYLLVIVLSVLLLLTPSYCPFGIFWSLCCLSFFYLLLLIASLVSFGHCVVCPSSTYSFLLPLWYLLVIVLSVLLLTPSYCLFGIFWSLCCLSFYLLLLIASLVSFGHCVVCPSSTYSFLLPLWYLLVIVLSVLLLLTPSYCLFGIFWSLCCLSFFSFLLTYSFLLPLWYLLVIVLSVLLLLTPSYCPFGIFWSLCCLSFYLLLLIAPLVYFGHCVVCPSTYSFLLPLWYLLVIVLSVLLLLTPSYCLFGIFWSLCCLSFFYLLLLIASLVSFGHCVVCPSSTYSFLLPLWYLLVIVLSVLLLLTPSYCPFGIFWSLCCLSFYLLLLIAPLVSFGHCVVCPSSTYSFLLPLWYLLVIVLSVLLLTPSYCPFGIFWSLCCLSFFYLLTPSYYPSLVSFGHCVVCPSTYSFLLPLWYLLVIVLAVLLLLTPSYCLFGIFWSLCCLSFFYLLLLIASLVSFGHCVVCPSTYSFLLTLWYLLVIVLSVLLLLTPSYCLFGIFWSLCWLSFFYLLLLIASLVSFGHCVVCPSLTYSFLLPLWYLLVIVLSVLLYSFLLTPSYCLFGIFWSLCCLSFYLLLLIASLVSFGHCVVCPSSTYSFLLPLWYLLVIVLSVLLLLTPSYCPFGIFWYCVPSTYSFLLPLWYLLVIVLAVLLLLTPSYWSVLLLLTPSYCLFGIFWSLCCLSFFYLLLLIASLVSFGHCVVCPSSTYSFLLPLWYLLVIVLSVLL